MQYRRNVPGTRASLPSGASAEHLTIGEMIEARKKKIEGTEKEKAKKAELKKKRAATKKTTGRKDSAHTTEQVSVEGGIQNASPPPRKRAKSRK